MLVGNRRCQARMEAQDATPMPDTRSKVSRPSTSPWRAGAACEGDWLPQHVYVHVARLAP
jgi:hypothetical protein